MPNPTIGPPVTPDFLSQVPKAVVRSLDVSEVLRDAMTGINHPEPYGPVIALASIESYFAAAKHQQRRIARARASIHRSFSSAKKVRPGKNLFSDVHFYLIAWARIEKLAQFIRKQTRFSRIGLVLKRYHTDLKNRIDARDHLEHFEDRLPGGKRRSKLAVPNDLLGMVNQYVTFGGRRLDIGPESIRLLKAFRDEFLTAVLYDSIDSLRNNDERQLLRLLKTASSNVSVARTTKKVEQMLKGRGAAKVSG